MSIYSSIFGFGDEHSPRCKQMRKVGPGVYQLDESKPCTCSSAPIKYQHSGVLPANSHERGGVFMLAAIPNHITGDGKDNRPENGRWRPWLRVSMFDAEDSIILTRKQVEKLRDTLNQWLKKSALAESK